MLHRVLPSLHIDPPYPGMHVHIPGSVHVPLIHGGTQTAVEKQKLDKSKFKGCSQGA